MKKMLHFIQVLFLSSAMHPSAAQAQSVRVVKDNLFIPWEIIYGPDDHIWFTQKNGYVCRLEPVSGVVDTVYYEAQTVVQNEGGMLGMALHPDFANDPYVYIAYEYLDAGDYKERVVRYTYTGGTLQMPQVLIDGIEGASIHNGCRLAIVEDKLFITTGDAGNTSLSQNLASLNGKILRINLDGSVPGDNPVPGNPVWSWGHRNAQGLVYHNGILYSSEHGPNNDDELNIISAGRNYGWPNVQGFCDLPAEMQYCADSNIAEPLTAWTPTLAVSGMEYYNHPMFPGMANSLLLTTLKDNNLYQLKLNAAGDTITEVTPVPGIGHGRLRDIAVAPDGRIFLSTSNSVASGSGQHQDMILELYDSTVTSLWSMHPDDGALMVYPNPATDMINVAFLQDGMNGMSWQYSISNLRGQVVADDRFESERLHVGQLAPGIYFLKLWNDKNQVAFKRFVKW